MDRTLIANTGDGLVEGQRIVAVQRRGGRLARGDAGTRLRRPDRRRANERRAR
jgi:hypothetical protein